MGEYGDLLELGNAGYIVDIAKEPFIGNYADQIKTQMSTPDGKIYGVPLDVSGMGIYYNKDLFKKAGIAEFPKTQTGLKEAIDKLKAAEITPFAVAGADPWTLAHSLFTTIAGTASDVKALSEQVKSGGALSSDALKNGFKTIDMMLANADGKMATNDYNAEMALLAQGKVAMIQQGYWAYSSILKINDKVNLGLAAIPYSEKAEDTKLGVNINVSYAISSDSKHADAAKKLFAWLTSKEGNQIANGNMQQIPAIEDVKVAGDPISADIQSYIAAKKVVPWAQVYMSGGTRTDAEMIMSAYMFKKKNLDQTIEAMQASWAKK
ncbi:ABC transporter substrate-binding protein [Paenibacillus sp. N3.4]|uniref:ABC transporter substrate-binding protein n=1 Tax=Paenibacillus sp. N3.4 TaxID=2603222 RepID=UPI0021C44FC7|nr:extracellular solute-binding protein [Paenibacillus sp. N3.4]